MRLMYCIYNYCVCCKYNYCVCSIYNYCVCCKYNFFVCSTYNFCVCCKYNYSVCFFPCASSCTVFCLYRHPFCKVCHLYRWMPVVYIYLSARTVYRSTICTVVWMYSRPSVQLSGCTVVNPQFSACTVIRSVQAAVCTVCYLYIWTPIRLYACTYSVFIHLYSHLFVLSSVCSVVCLYSRLSVQSPVSTVACQYSGLSLQSSVCPFRDVDFYIFSIMFTQIQL